jgi:hypothetical protein
LRRQYWPQHNRRFALAPAAAVDFHEPVPTGMKLDEVFSLEYERRVSNDWVVRYDNRFLQIEAAEVRPGAKVTIRIRRNGRMEVLYEGRPVRWHECQGAPKKSPAKRHSKARKPATRQPAADHPWRKRAVAAGAR